MTNTHAYRRGREERKKKNPSLGCAQCGKKGRKVGRLDEKTRSGSRAHFTRQKEFVKKKSKNHNLHAALGMTGSETKCHTLPFTHTWGGSPAAVTSHLSKSEHPCPVPLMPIYGHSQDGGLLLNPSGGETGRRKRVANK